MSESALELRTPENENEAVSVFGYELIREVLIHEILGNDAPEILYWAGKRLARKYPTNTLEEMIEFFQKASWGSLSVNKESRNEMDFVLFSPLIKERCQQKNNNCTFQLEAGFIAQQIELQKNVHCEAFEHPHKKKGKVTFTIKWDKKDILNP